MMVLHKWKRKKQLILRVMTIDSIQPGNSNARTNARTIAGNIATPDARSDRRLNWSNEEDIRLVSN